MLSDIARKNLFGVGMIAAISLIGVNASYGEKILYAFRGAPDGFSPSGGLIGDSTGNLLGVTVGGGTGTNCYEGNANGCGTIFQIAPGGAETVLYSFQGGSDGAWPSGRLLADGLGNLFGTTQQGSSCGTVFELAKSRTETVLYPFQCGTDGGFPVGDLVTDNSGNLYGATYQGGNLGIDECSNSGCGVVYKLAPDGTETVLYTFQGGNDGIEPEGGVIIDGSDNLYGTTVAGGLGGPNCTAGSYGCGTVFEIASDGTYTILHGFAGGSDGEGPEGDLLKDSAGNLYGTTVYGGGAPTCPFGAADGCGTVFKIASDGTESIVYAFQGGDDGAFPVAGLIVDKSGNLYGATELGGASCTKRYGCGTVFKLAPDGTETVLVAFSRSQGTFPTAPLLQKKGILYGTTSQGGAQGDGVVFKLKK